MTINVISDLHVNPKMGFYDRFNPADLKNADVIAIAGDIFTLGGNGMTEQYIQKFSEDFVAEDGSKKFKYLVWVKGNHDYYTYDFNDLSCTRMDVDRRNTITTIDGVSFLATTLWTNIIKNILAIQGGFPDYRMIPYFLVNDNNRLFEENLEWLETNAKLEKEKGNKVVILTHHCPHKKLVDPRFKDSNLNECFTVLDRKLYGRCSAIKAKYWIHGHSHCYANRKIGNTTYVRNPFGYIMEETGFKYDCIIKV